MARVTTATKATVAFPLRFWCASVRMHGCVHVCVRTHAHVHMYVRHVCVLNNLRMSALPVKYLVEALVGP